MEQKCRYVLLQLRTRIQPTYKGNLLPCVKEIQRSHRDHLLPEKFKKRNGETKSVLLKLCLMSGNPLTILFIS